MMHAAFRLTESRTQILVRDRLHPWSSSAALKLQPQQTAAERSAYPKVPQGTSDRKDLFTGRVARKRPVQLLTC